MMKKVSVVLLCAVILLTMTACNVKQKINEKIAEKVTEGVLEKVAGDGTKIDISEGGISFEGEGGEKITFGTDEWPKGGAADLIPEFKKGSIVSVVNAEKGCMILLEDVERKDAEDYIKKIKNQGFTKDPIDSSGSDGLLNYIAGLDEKTLIAVMYEEEGKGLSINVEINE